MASRRLSVSFAALFAAALAVAAAACPARVDAQQPAATPAAFVQALGDEVVAVLRESGRDAGRRRAALKAIFLRAFDVEAIGRFVLGTHWRTATPDQRARYMAAFPDYVADIYAAQFADYSGETFVVIREQRLGGRTTLVVTQIRRPDAPRIDVEFRVSRGSDGFKIVDVAVERLSLIITKRDEFSTFIRRQGLDALIAALERHARE